ncbi:MAG TPA: hypothetical protein VG733_11760 [Chthoniobacteraceae bacterium]|nr:hypothetical protein [Chthoniobacteraceae bacterium]
MNRNDCAVLTIRGFALYAWFSAVNQFTNGVLFSIPVTALELRGEQSMMLGLREVFRLGPPAVCAVIGLILFANATRFAAKMLPPETPGPQKPADGAPEQLPQPSKPPPMPQAFFPAAPLVFAGIGVFFMLGAVPTLALALTGLEVGKTALEQQMAVDNYAPRIVGEMVRLAIGFFLFLKARPLAELWARKQRW